MARLAPSAFTVRQRRAWWLGLAACVGLAAGGCQHNRSAMRPVYVESAPVVAAPCPAGTPGCDTTSGLPSSAPVGSRVVPQSGNGEPTLKLPSSGGETPTDLEAIPPNTNGGVSPPAGAQRTPTRSSGRVTMKSRVAPFVNDPDDLFQPPKADRPWKYVVLHHSAHAKGSYAQIDQDHRKTLGTAGCGYHFVIGNGSESPDGQIEVAQRWSDQKAGAHCRDARTTEVNDYGIGICLVGNLEEGPPTVKQIEAARALVAYLRTRYNIPTDRVGTHMTLASHPTVCPGKNFPIQAILGGRSVAMR